jgi:hypothetical protein
MTSVLSDYHSHPSAWKHPGNYYENYENYKTFDSQDALDRPCG